MSGARATLVAAATAVAGELEARQAELDGLDRIAGDGDHGATMVLGSRAVLAALEAAGEAPVGELLKLAAAAFASVGGSIGPLWGTALLRAGQSLGADPRPSARALAGALTAASEGVGDRGRAVAGDKTLLDVLAPAAAALEAAAGSGAGHAELLQATAAAAREGLARSTPWVPRRGRARRLGERSAGHADPGSASACHVIEAVCRSLA
jgi:phosphoenolpyruvate---glycerone phosphotransferase subunit DhaL